MLLINRRAPIEYLVIPLLLQSFKHDAVLDAESEIGASTMLFSFRVVCGLTKILSGYHQILTTKKTGAIASVYNFDVTRNYYLYFLALCRVRRKS